MKHAILTIVGAAVLLAGVYMLLCWVSGKSRWFDPGVFDRAGASKNDRQFLDLYYIVLVLAPLLCGTAMMLMGLRRWL